MPTGTTPSIISSNNQAMVQGRDASQARRSPRASHGNWSSALPSFCFKLEVVSNIAAGGDLRFEIWDLRSEISNRALGHHLLQGIENRGQISQTGLEADVEYGRTRGEVEIVVNHPAFALCVLKSE